MCSWVHTIGVNDRAHFPLPAIDIYPYQNGRGTTNPRNSENQAGSRVIYRRARNTQWIDISAWERVERHRRANVCMPLHTSRLGIEGVQSVSLCRSNEMVAYNQRFCIDCSVQLRTPGLAQSMCVSGAANIALAWIIMMIRGH